jgi:hypothetical protein
MSARPKGTAYVVARNGQVELRRTNFSGAVHIFAQGAVSAVMQGDVCSSVRGLINSVNRI